MNRTHLGQVCCRRFWMGALLFCLAASGSAIAQTAPPHDEYYEICRREGYLPGTTPMRRCIEARRADDLDPLNALSEYRIAPTETAEPGESDPGLTGAFPGARSAEELLKRSPEELLLGPDYRAQGQGIYE